MGNNPSNTRKLTAGVRAAPVRKSSATAHHDLEEEFSDLILHEVKRQQEAALKPVGPPPYQFTNDLIEDEFNELNDGLIETDATEVSRNIIPNDSSASDRMDIDAVGNVALPEVSSAPDLSQVNFAKIAASTGSRVDNLYLEHEKPSKTRLTALIPVEIKWVNSSKEQIGRIAIIGLFSNWRDVIKLKPLPQYLNEYVTTVKLPLGVHKLLYIIDNEYRVSDQLPTATDQEGIFFNWFEVLDHLHLFNHLQKQPDRPDASTQNDANIIQVAGQHDSKAIQRKLNSFLARVSKETPDFDHIEYQQDEEMADEPAPAPPLHQRYKNKYVPYHESLLTLFLHEHPPQNNDYLSEIPEMFVNYDYFKSKASDYELPEPPQLPAHLNNVLLNKILIQQHQLNLSQTLPQLSTTHLASLDSSSSKRPTLRRADSSYYASNHEAYHLSIPNHVILNHLMTTSIRNDILTVACITRYSGKFVTQIMHSPAETEQGGAKQKGPPI